jgi:hypothetical protein
MSHGPFKRSLPGDTHGARTVRHDALAAAGAVLVGLAALGFVLILLPWIVSI